MACLARTVSTRASCLSVSTACTSCHAAARISHRASVGTTSSSSSSSKLLRLCTRARFARSAESCESPKYYLSSYGNAEPAGASSPGLTDRVRTSLASRLAYGPGAFSGSLRFCSSSGGASWNHRGTVESVNPAAAATSNGGADAIPRRRPPSSLERLACPGCGVYMQDKDPKGPGYFKMPAALEKLVDETEGEEFDDDSTVDEEDDNSLEFEDLDDELEEGDIEGEVAAELEVPEWALDNDDNDEEEEIDLSNVAFSEWNEVGGSKQAAKDAWSEILGRKRRSFKDTAAGTAPTDEGDEETVVVCARCHALRNYGKVKDESLENLLPDFDFERVVGTRLKQAYGRRAVVLMVVDGSDFDGSFPRKAAAVLAEAERELGTAWQEGKSGNTPRLLVVMNKIDLLPKQIAPKRLEQWVRRRAKAGGVPRLTGVHLVSAFKGWGVEELAERVKELAGARGDCWVVGAQNAGKSSLINSFAKFAGEGRKVTRLTEAPVPGTTLGVLKLEGILPARARLFDTPGLLHPHQITTRLNREEQKLVQVRKELKPRTFRVKKGSTVHVGGLLRLDVVDAPSESIYMTVWASPQLPCHMGKVEKAQELFDKHIGDRLKPPMDKERAAEIGRWVVRCVSVTGDSWDNSSVDVAVAGLGWVGIGVKGTAVLQAWTYEGVAVTTHEAMVYDMANIFEKPGFTAMKAPSKGEKKSNVKSKEARVKEAV